MLLGGAVAGLDGIRLRHVLALLGLSVITAALLVINARLRVHPHHRGVASRGNGLDRLGGCGLGRRSRWFCGRSWRGGGRLSRCCGTCIRSAAWFVLLGLCSVRVSLVRRWSSLGCLSRQCRVQIKVRGREQKSNQQRPVNSLWSSIHFQQFPSPLAIRPPGLAHLSRMLWPSNTGELKIVGRLFLPEFGR
jgi:hypothetical protein